MAPKAAPASLSPLSRPPLERMLRIHQAIVGGNFPNATTLARELEVSTKSIHRDLDFMRDRLALPIDYDSLRRGYHYTSAVTAFPGFQITEGELFTLLVAEKALQQYRGTSFEKPLASAFRKMAASLPDPVTVHWEDWDQTISFKTSAEPILDLEVFDRLARAVSGRQRLRLAYRKPGQKAFEERVVDPYHLANINGEWFLFAYCHLRRGLRTFVPSRIGSADPTGETFSPKSFSLEKQLRGSFGVFSGEGRHRVVLRFDGFVADYIREKRWHPSQQLAQLADGGVELRLDLSSLAEIQRWVLGWGAHVRVVEPPELARSVREVAKEILSAYAETSVTSS